MTFVNNSSIITIQSWFIPLDIVAILILILGILLGIIIILIIIVNKECHTVPMLLVANICLTGVISGIAHLTIIAFSLHNDLKQIAYYDIYCIIRGYSSYVTGAMHNYSYVISSLYRYISVVYPTHLSCQSARMQILFIIISWLLSVLSPLVVIFTNDIIYSVDNQICQVPFQLSFSLLYLLFIIYIIPIQLVIFIYFKLVRYVCQMRKHVTPVNILCRAQKDLKMVRQIVILVHILVLNGFALTLFIFLSFAGITIKYCYRIGFIGTDATPLCIMIALFKFTDRLRALIKKTYKSSNKYNNNSYKLNSKS